MSPTPPRYADVPGQECFRNVNQFYSFGLHDHFSTLGCPHSRRGRDRRFPPPDEDVGCGGGFDNDVVGYVHSSGGSVETFDSDYLISRPTPLSRPTPPPSSSNTDIILADRRLAARQLLAASVSMLGGQALAAYNEAYDDSVLADPIPLLEKCAVSPSDAGTQTGVKQFTDTPTFRCMSYSCRLGKTPSSCCWPQTVL